MNFVAFLLSFYSLFYIIDNMIYNFYSIQIDESFF